MVRIPEAAKIRVRAGQRDEYPRARPATTYTV